MSVLVIIVTYNAMQWVARCMDNLRDSAIPVDIFVVDNGSTDGTQDFIRARYPNVMFCQNAENEGFGKANNRGLQYAIDKGYDYVYLMNQDAWIQENTIQDLVRIAELHPEYGIVGPVQLDGTGHHLELQFCRSTLRSDIALSNYFSDLYFREDEGMLLWALFLKGL